MDITLPVSYRGLLLTGANIDVPGGAGVIEGIRLTRARYGDVTVHGYTEKRSLDDGMDASDVFLGARQVILQGEVYAATAGALYDLLDLLRLKFTPTDAYNESTRTRGYLPLYFQQPTLQTIHWPLGIIDKELRCRPAAQPDFDIQFAAIGGERNDPLTGGFVVPVVLRLEAKDPRFYGIDDKDFLFPTGGVVKTDTLPRNRGNYPAPVNLVLSTDDTGVKVFTLVGVNTNMEVTIPAGTGRRTVVVDGYAKVVTLTAGGAETLRMDLVKFIAGNTWPRADPLTEQMEDVEFNWGFAGGGLVTGSRMSFRETWA